MDFRYQIDSGALRAGATRCAGSEYPLKRVEDDKAEVTLRVERMRINPAEKSELRYNDFLTLRGIPLNAYNYRLGNRSALESVVDQYRVTTEARSGIVNDPNREDDPKYILRLSARSSPSHSKQTKSSLPCSH